MSKKLNEAYGLTNPLQKIFPRPIIAKRAPTTLDVGYPIAQVWLDTVGATAYTLMSVAGGSSTWSASYVGTNLSVAGSITAGTTLTATNGDITATDGNIVLGTAGNKIESTNVGTAAAAGANSIGSAVMVAGTVTIATTAVTADSLIHVWRQGIGATGAAAIGIISVGTVVAGTSFIINALDPSDATAVIAADVSVVGYMIIN